MSLPGSETGNDVHVLDVAGIPIRFSPMWLILVVLAFRWAGSMRDGVIMVVALTLSIVVHELGHAFASKAYGLQPSILIHAFGGWTRHLQARTPNQDLIVVAAGPGAGLALALVSFVLLLAWRASGLDSAVLPFLLPYLVSINVYLSILNLLPVLPLDGGRIALNAAQRYAAPAQALRTTALLSVVVAALAALGAAALSDWFIAIFFVALGVRAGMMLRDA
ncbi:MAG: site-2 protease family protein [Alphaproteobacteria bacterium]|nr:site-2 protease family protein [Alphaproteobacteria bacterium]